MSLNKNYVTAYIGKNFINTYNVFKEFQNQGTIQRPLILEEFIGEIIPVIKRTTLDLIFIENDAIIPTVNGNFIDAVEYLKVNAPRTRIIVIAPGYKNPAGMKKLVSFGVFDIITDIQKSDNPADAFTTHRQILTSSIINPQSFASMRKYLDYEDSILSDAERKRINESKKSKSKKNKNASKIAIFTRDSNKLQTELFDIFNQQKNYDVVQKSTISHHNFSDVSSDVQYLVLQDPTPQELKQFQDSSRDYLIISLYTSYVKYEKRDTDEFAMLYSMTNNEDFLVSMEKQIRDFQNQHALSDSGEYKLSDFIPEGYVKKTPWWKKFMIFLLVMGIISGVVYSAKVVVEAALAAQANAEKELQAERMTLELTTNPLQINPNESINLESLIKEIEEGSTVSYPELDDSLLKKEGTFELVFTIDKGELSKSVELEVIVKDTKAPNIKLKTTSITVDEGTTPNWKEYLVSASDNYDGDVTSLVTGEYKSGAITYTVKDKAGNSTTEKIAVSIKQKAPVVTPPVNNNTGSGNSGGGGNTSGGQSGGTSGGGTTNPVAPSTTLSIVGPSHIYADATTNVATFQQQVNSALSQYRVVGNKGAGSISRPSLGLNPNQKGEYPITLNYKGQNGEFTSRTIILVIR